MKAVKTENREVVRESVVLPKDYNKIENSALISLHRTYPHIPMDVEGDSFGKIDEYFLGRFARVEGAKGGEFFTPTTMVKLIVAIIEPYHGRIFDPTSWSASLFVPSAGFVKAHKKTAHPTKAYFVSCRARRRSKKSGKWLSYESCSSRSVRRQPAGKQLLLRTAQEP